MFATQVSSPVMIADNEPKKKGATADEHAAIVTNMSHPLPPFSSSLPTNTQIASSMAYVHAKGIAHLDLKTANILLSADATRTVIADFGISQTQDGPPTVNPVFVSGSGGAAAVGSGTEMRRMASNASSAPVLALTPHYCAPERLTMKDLSFSDLLASDVYTYGG